MQYLRRISLWYFTCTIIKPINIMYFNIPQVWVFLLVYLIWFCSLNSLSNINQQYENGSNIPDALIINEFTSIVKLFFTSFLFSCYFYFTIDHYFAYKYPSTHIECSKNIKKLWILKHIFININHVICCSLQGF